MNKSRLFNIVGVAVILLISLGWMHECSRDPDVVVPAKDELKQTIREQKQNKDSAHQEVMKWDSVRVPTIHNYKKFKVKKDSMPCPEALAELIILTDTIVEVDSLLIGALKAELLIDSIIIRSQDAVIKMDSVALLAKDKKIRKLKRQRNVAAGIGVVGWIIAAFK